MNMNEFERINQIVETTNTVDFRIQSYDSVNLMITGSFDFCYYHEVEFIFHEVSYISLPNDFSYPKFREATAEETTKINQIIVVDEEETVYCIVTAQTKASLTKRL